MKKFVGMLLAIGFMVAAEGAFAKLDGDVEAGKTKAGVCAACHGVDGNSINPIWPSIAGQHALYSYRQLTEFKKGAAGKRANPVMDPIIAQMTDQDFKDLSVFFATQVRTVGQASKTNLDLGMKLYRGGDAAAHVSACIACHGPQGLGNRDAGFPKLTGQHAAYVSKTLKDYRSGARANSPNQIMEKITQRMTDQEIDAVANYIQGLH